MIANDPDADRLAVAVPGEPGAAAATAATAADWRVLTGDELGALLGDELIARYAGVSRAVGDTTPVVASSIVSSSLLGKIAAAAGVVFIETLTGFKWIARAADGVPGGRLLFGYEEALGYTVSPAVRDKDGLSAALLVAELVAEAREQGRALTQRLDRLEERFGVHATAQWSLRLEGAGAHQELVAIVDRWRRNPPTRLGGLEVVEVIDLEQPRAGLPATAGVLLRLGSPSDHADAEDPLGPTARVVVRPSGTEPKLKAYLEVVTPPPGASGLEAARHAAGEKMETLRADVAASLSP